jgi:hypothetical protein
MSNNPPARFTIESSWLRPSTNPINCPVPVQVIVPALLIVVRVNVLSAAPAIAVQVQDAVGGDGQCATRQHPRAPRQRLCPRTAGGANPDASEGQVGGVI